MKAPVLDGNSPPWRLIGAPVDCSGRSRGEERGPAALRAAGLAPAFEAEDAGDVGPLIDDARRDPDTGVIGLHRIVEVNRALKDTVRQAIDEQRRPLVAGGDCSMLPGACAAVRAKSGARLGLCFVDGHVDCLDGETSPTGEAADMPLAVMFGRGAEEWLAVGDPRPLLDPGDVAVLGHRDGPDDREEIGYVPAGVELRPASSLAGTDMGRLGEEAVERLGALPAGFWLHLDVDVLDEREMPASTYAAPGGLGWAQLEELLPPVMSSPRLAGMSLADLRPDLDLDGVYAARLVALLAEAIV